MLQPRSNRLRRSYPFILLAGLAAPALTCAGGHAILDVSTLAVSLNDDGGDFCAGIFSAVAQTFIPSYPLLVSLDLYMTGDSATNDVAVYRYDGTLPPTTAPIVTVTVFVSTPRGSHSWPLEEKLHRVTFSEPVPVTPGETYLIEIFDQQGRTFFANYANAIGGPGIGDTFAQLCGQPYQRRNKTLAFQTWGAFPPCKSAPGKVTGGGEIDGAVGRASFGFNARRKNDGDAASGRLNYVNHDTGEHVNGPVDELLFCDDDGRAVLSGRCSAATGPCTFEVEVRDLGEPGRNVDTFGIVIDRDGGGESQPADAISKGNIQLH